jgi:hypothetical protein
MNLKFQFYLTLYKIKTLFKKKHNLNWQKDKRVLFMMTAETGLLFYERVIKWGAKTPKEKEIILKLLAEAGQMKNVVQTNRTREEVVQDLAKEFKVLDVQYEKPKEQNNEENKE